MDIEKAIDCLKADKEYLTDMKICDGEEIENIYGRETELSEEIRDLLDDLN